jgi:hypothetical protein
MNTLRTVLSFALILTILLPSILPLIPVVRSPETIAAAQGTAYIISDVDVYNRIISYGTVFKVYIYDEAALAKGYTTVNATVIVAGTANYNVEFTLNTTSGYYEATFNITRIGTTDKAQVVVDSRTLVGTLSDGNTLVVQYLPEGWETPVTATFTYRLADIIVNNRLHGGYYWVPRLDKCIWNRYNAEGEWRFLIPGYTADNATVELTIEDRTTGYVTSMNITVVREGTSPYFKPADAVEAEKITAMLVNVSLQMSSPWWITGVDFDNPQFRGDEVIATARIVETGQASKTRKLAIFISDAVVEIQTTGPTQDIVITVYDADENLNAVAAENTINPIELLDAPFPDGAVVMTFNLTETSASSGVFRTTINLLDYPALWGTVLSPTDNVIDWHFSDLRLDNYALQKAAVKGCTALYCDKFNSVTVPYHTAEFNVIETSVALRSSQRCCPIPKITLQITDPDAETGEDVVVRGMVPAGEDIYMIPLELLRYGVSTGIPGYRLTIYVKDSNGNLYNITALENLTIAFYRIAENTIEFQLDLTKLNWTGVNAEIAAAGAEPAEIIVRITDCMAVNAEGAPEPQTLEDTVQLGAVQIEVDRTILPIAYLSVDGINWTGTCPVTRPEIEVGPTTAQIVHIEVYDNGTNVDCCEVDEIPPNAVKLVLHKEYKGQTVIHVEGDGLITVPLYDVASDGTQGSLRGFCYIEIPGPLVETGADTGVFVGELQIWSEIDGRLYAGCPSIWLNNTKLYITYVSPAIGSASAEITFKFMDAEISVVDPETNEPITEVKLGQPVKVIVTDPDANLDITVNETVLVEYTIEGAGIPTATSYLWLTQTDPASNTFEATVYIDWYLISDHTCLYLDPSICTACYKITFKYIDRTPVNPSAVQLYEQLLPGLVRENADQPLDWLAIVNEQCLPLMEKTVSIDIYPTVAKVYIEFTVERPDVQDLISETIGSIWQDVTNKTGVPALNTTVIRIIVEDSDHNLYSTMPETWEFIGKIIVDGKVVTFSRLGLIFTETGDNTGVFVSNEFTLQQLAELLGTTAYDLAGKKITVQVTDTRAYCAATCAQAATNVKSYTYVYDILGEVKIVDAVTGEPKDFYRCACPFGGACPTGGDLLEFIVKDIQLVDLYGGDYDTTAPISPVIINVLIEKAYGEVEPNPNPVMFSEASVELVETEDGVYVPVSTYTALGRLYCFPQAGTNIIVASDGENVTLTYYDAGQATEVSYKAAVGTPPIQVAPNEASNVTETRLFIVEAGAFKPVEVIPAGKPAYIQVRLEYDTATMSSVLQQILGTGDVFAVVFFIEDAAGNLVDYGFKPVAVGDMTVGFGFTLEMPGTYKITILPVASAENPVPLSTPLVITVTVS